MASVQAPAPAPRLVVPLLVVGLLVGVVAVLAWPAASPGPRAQPAATGARGRAPSRLEAEAAEVLRGWDRRRAAAWAAGDTAMLRALYVPRSSAGRADVAMLRGWTGRGYVVEGLTTQLLAVRVLRHDRARWVLQVRDRVTHARAARGGVVEPLPAGAAADREVVLRRTGDTWRVASVRPRSPRGPARH